MSVQDIITTLHDFLVAWLTDAGFRSEYGDDLQAALSDHGFDDVDPETLLECLPLVAEDLPLVYQRSIYDYMNTVSNVDSGSSFEVNQGGGDTDVSGGGSHGGHHSGGDLDEVVRHIYNIQHVTEKNYSYIDDSGDVTTTVTAAGDVDFDQVVASGDGAVAAGDDVSGVNTGTNNGIVAGDDVEDSEVTNVTGDGNVTGEVGEGATVLTGDDNVLANDSNVIDGDFSGGQFVGGDVEDSNLIGGNNKGQAVGDGKGAAVNGGDAGVVAASGAHVTADDVNVGGAQYDIDADDSAINFGKGDVAQDNSTHVKVDDSFNTDNSVDNSIDDSFNTDNSIKAKDSFNTDNSTNLDVEVDDSFNDNSDNSTTTIDKSVTDNSTDVKIEDSLNTDKSVEIEDSLNDNSDHSTTDNSVTDNSTDVDIEESFTNDEDNDSYTKTETETTVIEDNDGIDGEDNEVDVHH